MNDTLISIIVPAYNIEKYVGRCLDSILNQTYKKLEIIVVNDGSTDGTGKILDQYAQQNTQICVLHKKNGGVSSARVAGVKKSSGDFIGFVDGDDYVEPEMFELLLNNALKHNADISHCGYQMVFPDGHVDLYYGTGNLVVQNHDIGLHDLIRGDFIEPGLCNKLYRRDIVDRFYESPLWDESIKINEDLLMNYILFSKAEHSVYEDIPYYHYVLRKGSAATSTVNENKLKDPVRVMQRLHSNSVGTEWFPTAIQRYLRQLIAVSTMPLGNQKELIEPYRKEIRKQLRQEIKAAVPMSEISTKIKLMALWASIFPTSYRWVHSIYLKITGLDKKYSLE